ncbi:MAG TPA: hypothetical protein VLM05_02010 [Mycobacteriales bacterium]|nr:hypothetical protein [Mycobacteriales bacterium]
MRRSTWLVGVVVAGVVGGGAVAASAAPEAGAPASGPAAASAHGTVLRYDIVFRPQSENYVDIGSPGPGVGDLLVFQDRILDRTGRQVGVEGGTCTITAILADGFQTHCVGTVSLPGGQIAFQGLVTDKPEKRMAVVGGTGRYRDAGGELTVLELGHDEAGTLTVRLTGR